MKLSRGLWLIWTISGIAVMGWHCWWGIKADANSAPYIVLLMAGMILWHTGLED